MVLTDRQVAMMVVALLSYIALFALKCIGDARKKAEENPLSRESSKRLEWTNMPKSSAWQTCKSCVFNAWYVPVCLLVNAVHVIVIFIFVSLLLFRNIPGADVPKWMIALVEWVWFHTR